MDSFKSIRNALEIARPIPTQTRIYPAGQDQLAQLEDLIPGDSGTDAAARHHLGQPPHPHGHWGRAARKFQHDHCDQRGTEGTRRHTGQLAQDARCQRHSEGRKKLPQADMRLFSFQGVRSLTLLRHHLVPLYPPVGQDNDGGQTGHAEYHPHELHHRHHGGVRPHVQGDERGVRHTAGSGTKQGSEQIQVCYPPDEKSHRQIQGEKGGHHRQIGPDDPGQTSQVLRSHQTADVGPGQHLGHHPGLRPDVRLSCSQVHQYRAQDGTYQHPAWDPQPHQQQAAPRCGGHGQKCPSHPLTPSAPSAQGW